MHSKILIVALLLFCAPAFSASYTDDFNRANESPLADPPWDILGGGGFLVSSNAAMPVSGGDQFTAYDNTVSDDQYSEVTLGGISAGGQVGPGVRMSNTGSYAGYNLYIGAGGSGWSLQRLPGSTVIASDSDTFVTTDVVRLEISGTALTVKLNGATIGSTTDATHSTGKPGLIAYGGETDASFTDWAGGDLASASGLLLRRRR